jgi:hypothetical protein
MNTEIIKYFLKISRAVLLLTLFLCPGGNLLSAEDFSVYYQRGAKLAVPSAGFELKLRTEIAGYYSFTNYSAPKNNTATGIVDKSGSKNSFDIQRANLIVAGNVADKRFSYFIKYGAVNTDFGIYGDLFEVTNPNNGGELLETWGQWNAPNNNAKLRIGKQKLPFGLQRAMQDTDLQFVTPALSNQLMLAGFDRLADKNKIFTLSDKFTGITGQSVVQSSDNMLVTWTTGVFNQTAATNDGTNVLGLFGVNFAGNGYDRTVEGDRNYSQNLAWTTGLTGTFTRLSLEGRSVDVLNGVLDAAFKYRGFSWQSEGVVNYANDATREDSVNIGYYTQLGYFIAPQIHELAFRFSGIDSDRDLSNNRGFEYALNYNYYLVGDFLKFQAGVSYYDLKLSQVDKKYQVVKGLVGLSGVF